ncbi:lipid II flippase family protein [Paenibacillus alginolyticus]|uniref:lipid II flippase family protein n=1 Tax=Paenibacillus alginolyticus TaxID=59839 RepID=UPI0035E42386
MVKDALRVDVIRNASYHIRIPFGSLMLSRFCGTVLAQIIFIPAAYWIKWVVPYL